MARPMQPITVEQLAQIDTAVSLLRESCRLLKIAKAPRALERARMTLRSAEGAQRHAWRRYIHTGTSHGIL